MSAIAREAGVGKATVSLALRNDPRLRLETRERIQEVARTMGYQANAVVSSLMAQLRGSKNPKFQATVGLINASVSRDSLRTNATFKSWSKGIRERSAELGYVLDEFWLHEPGVRPERLAQILRTRNIRGVIIAGVLEHRQLPENFHKLWNELACVVVGIRPEQPALHFACNDQFSTAMHTALELERLGYRRPGLVIDPIIEENIDYRFSAGFYARKQAFCSEERVPMLDFRADGEQDFRGWLKSHRPDVIVCTHPEIREWIANAGISCPGDIGLVHLDVTPGMEGWSGMNQNNDAVGAFAVDIVVGQLHRNETGIPERPKCMMIESQWVQGTTVRSVAPKSSKSAKPAKKVPAKGKIRKVSK